MPSGAVRKGQEIYLKYPFLPPIESTVNVLHVMSARRGEENDLAANTAFRSSSLALRANQVIDVGVCETLRLVSPGPSATLPLPLDDPFLLAPHGLVPFPFHSISISPVPHAPSSKGSYVLGCGGWVLRRARAPAAVTLLVTLSPNTVGPGARRHKMRGSRPGRRVSGRRTLMGRLPLRGRARRGRADADCQGRTIEPPSPRLRTDCQGVCSRGPSLHDLARSTNG